MDKKLVKRCRELGNEMTELFNNQINLRKKLSEAIHDMVLEMTDEDGCLDFDDEVQPCIAYDGGNHVEYASTLASTVYAVKASEHYGIKTFELKIEDSDSYDEERVLFKDVCMIFDYIYGLYILEDRNKNE